MLPLKQYMSSTHMPQGGDWDACIKRAAQMGFDGLELFGGEFGDETLMEKGRLKALGTSARRQGLILSAHPWVEWAEMPADGLAAASRKLLEDCSRLGVREVNLHMGFFATRENGVEQLFETFDPLMGFLASEDMTLLFENVPGHGLGQLGSEIADFTALFTHYGLDTPVSMTVDNGHAHMMGYTQALIHRWGHRWRYTHINDNNGLSDQHLPPGQGTVNWIELAQCARQCDYQGPLMMEFAMAGLRIAMPVLTLAFGLQGLKLEGLMLEEWAG